MSIIYWPSYEQCYVSDDKTASGMRRSDWRFWMAYANSAVMNHDDCLFAVMDDFGNLVETDGRAYNKNARIGAIFGN